MNSNKVTTKKFDLRPINYDTGKRMALPTSEKATCACCGRKIAMGWMNVDGETIGSECAVISDQMRYQNTITERMLIGWGWSRKQMAFYGIEVI